MAAIEVKPVRSRGDLKRFIKLPWRIYRNAENWVPPLIMERKRHLDRERNPFFGHAEAEYFLAWRDGEPVGRITAHVDHRFNEFQDNDWGMFGFFESVDDREVAGALLGAAEEWLRERGRDRMIGPMDFSTNHECGVLVEGFDVKPQILESWHHPYYQSLLEACGLTKAMDLYKWSLHMSARQSRLLPVLEQLAEKLEPEHGITVRNMRRRDFKHEVERFMDVYNKAWERNWGFVPLTEDELRAYAKDLKPILDENWAFIAEKDGEVVGVGAHDPRLQRDPGQGERPPAAVRLDPVPARQGHDQVGARVGAGRPARVPAHRRGGEVLHRALRGGRPAAPEGRRDRVDPGDEHRDEQGDGGDGRRHREDVPHL